MGESPTTRASLLVRIRDPGNGQAWEQFVEIYAPLVHGFARKRGLQNADAADLTQDVLGTVSRGVKNLDYDPSRGSFRGWLFTIVGNHLRNFWLRRAKEQQGSGNSAAQKWLQDQAAPGEDFSAVWEEEHQQRLFAWASKKVKSEVETATWQAFWQTSVEGRSAKEAGQALGMSVAAIYKAKSRVLARLKELIQHLDEP
jgi:RNA polymerase sigma-70 factor (ECF subfamily)